MELQTIAQVRRQDCELEASVGCVVYIILYIMFCIVPRKQSKAPGPMAAVFLGCFHMHGYSCWRGKE